MSMLHPLHTKERSVEPQRSSTRIPPSMAGPRVHRLHIVLGREGCQGSPNAIAACPPLSLYFISRLTLLPEAEELPVVVASNLNQASCRALFFRRHPMYLSICLSTSLWCSNVQIVVSFGNVNKPFSRSPPDGPCKRPDGAQRKKKKDHCRCFNGVMRLAAPSTLTHVPLLVGAYKFR